MPTTLPSFLPPVPSSASRPFPLSDETRDDGGTVVTPWGVGRVTELALAMGDGCMRRS